MAMAAKITRLPEEAFEELRGIAQKEIKETMTDSEIEEMGVNLLNLFDIITTQRWVPAGCQPNLQEAKALRFLREELGKGHSPSNRGLASAMIRPTRTRFLAMTSARAMPRPARGPFASTATRENTMADGRRRRRHSHHAGSSKSSVSTHGDPNSRWGRLME